MSHRSTRRLAAIAATSALALAATGGALLGATAAPGRGAGADAVADASGRAGVDSTSAVVQLASAPLATSERTRPAPGRKIDFSGASVRAERARLAAERNAFKRWLRQHAPAARVVGEFDVAVNAVSVDLNGTSLDTLRSAPGVVSVDFQATYVPIAHEDPDLDLVDGAAGWALAGDGSGATVGEGVRVAVVDSGIDPTHPCFAPAQDRIVVEKVFHMRARQQGYSAIPTVESHGTHVAGTIGCNPHTDAAVNGVQVDYDPSGVAPGVSLGNYNVFPADVGSARSEDILDALDEAAEDGMDVVNMSLGGGASGVQDLLTIAVDNLDRAGIVVAVAAGNDGPGYFTVGSPGSAERALTAGASSVGHVMALPLTGVDAKAGGTVGTAVGDFPVPDAPITGALVPVVDGKGALRLGCSASDFSAMPSTEIAVVGRGACTFSQKVAGAKAAGAEALVVVNNVAGDPTAMGRSAGLDDELPAVMAGLGDRAALSTPDPSVTLETTLDYVQTGNDNIMAGFSSKGPTDVDHRVKPDVVAPGVNVLSSVLEGEGSWAFFQGTSMATPHLAGMAAAVIQTWRDDARAFTAEHVRSAIVNTAVEDVLLDAATATRTVDDANVVGAGLANLPASIGAEYAVSPVSTSFGAVPARSRKPLTRTVSVTAWDGSISPGDVSVEGAGFSAAQVRVSGGTATVTVAFDPSGAAGAGHAQGVLRVGDAAHSVLYAFVK
ncbi:MAG: S8 family serine peptidase [Actinomycetes bacterium]